MQHAPQGQGRSSSGKTLPAFKRKRCGERAPADHGCPRADRGRAGGHVPEENLTPPMYSLSAMRKLMIGAALAALASIAACDAGGATGSAGVAGSSSEKVDYANGHPLLLPNSDPGVTVFETELLRLVDRKSVV